MTLNNDLTRNVSVPEDLARTSVTQLQLSEYLMKRLLWSNILDLGTLLNTDYETFKNMRNVGEKYLKELIDYVHSLGYTIKGEENFLSGILEEKRARGIKLLEDYGFSPRIYLTLYRNGIYTLEELLEYGREVNNLKRFGPLRQKELADKMQELGISFVEKQPIELRIQTAKLLPDGGSSLPSDETISQLIADNNSIRTMINRKTQLLKQYESLLKERQELLAREQELDSQIQEKLKALQEGVGGIQHG